MTTQSIVDDIVDWLKALILGDFVEEQPISAQIVGGAIALIPVVQQVMNARDISGVLFHINRKGGFAAAEKSDYMNLGFAAIAVIPEVGSVFKMVFKPLWKERRLAGPALRSGLDMLERMLGMAKGGAVKWIKALEWGTLTRDAIARANAALDAMEQMLIYLSAPHWWVPDRLASVARDALPGVQSMRGKISGPLTEGVNAVRDFVNHLVGEDTAAVLTAIASAVPSTSSRPRGAAEARARANHTGNETRGAAPPVQTHPRTGDGPTQSVDTGHVNTGSKTTQPTQSVLAKVTRTIQGIVGEHIVDYHCLEGKAWGLGWSAHDKGKDGRWEASPLKNLSSPGKLNDGTHLVQLVLQGPRGRGIDGLWRKKATGPQKYAVVEAKCYMTPTTSLKSMLDDVYDKDELQTYRDDVRTAKDAAKPAGGGKGKRGRGGTTPAAGGSPSTPPKKPVKHVMQMSHVWIENRVRESYDLDVRDEILRKFGASPNYSRHVMLVSIPQVVDHYQAIEKAISSGVAIDPKTHTNHTITREFGDAQLNAEERSRATAKTGPAPVLTP
ncbi:hypothetical protein M2282_006219 [Variovorax boronicumulans]|uniref:hypothetical protein n=1 Tax=Variovorax boronicumulans TaxID=436515 RepID=UPI0024767AE3|nr:hypothetical protein [Variovorax boronicumulans]MDH6171033.1 hypothetical protein [Variovorax boronicumulans]